MTSPRRILVVTPDRVGPARAGMAMRNLGVARALARRGFDVTLASTDLRSQGPGDELRFGHLKPAAPASLFERYDVCLIQSPVLQHAPELWSARTHLVVDLVCPVFLENLERFRGRVDQSSRVRDDLDQACEGLLAGDSFICGSERQRHFWLGMLAALGRIDGRATHADPDLARFLRVVPPGLDVTPPAHGSPALRGVVPGIEAGDLVLLWGGGLWGWLDPFTPIRAVASLAPRLPVRLVFPGVKHPQDERPRTEVAERAMALARELGLLDRNVFFLEGWAADAELDRYLGEADLGLSAHSRTLESTFAVRTRLSSYLRGGLPIVASQGDELADLVAEHDLGSVVGVDDVAGFARAIERLADPAVRGTCADRVRRLAATRTWDRQVEPLAELASDPRLPADRRRERDRFRPNPGSRSRALLGDVQKFRASIRSDGLRVALGRARRKVGSRLGHASVAS